MLAVSDLVFPRGEIQPGWFDDNQSPDDAIAAWIGLECGDDVDDDVARYRIYARCYRMIAGRMAALPMQARYGGQGGTSTRYDKAQIVHWQRLAEDADEKADEYETGQAAAGSARTTTALVYATY